MYTVTLTNKSDKQFRKLEVNLRFRYARLFKTLQENPFIDKLYENTYHTHVQYHWVAVWDVDKNLKTVTITYIGSREGAPY